MAKKKEVETTDAVVWSRKKAPRLKEGEVVLAECETGTPYLTKKGVVLVPTRDVAKDEDGWWRPCKVYRNGTTGEPENENHAGYLVLRPVPDDMTETVKEILGGDEKARGKVKRKVTSTPKVRKRDSRLPDKGTIMEGSFRGTSMNAVENEDGTFQVWDLDEKGKKKGNPHQGKSFTSAFRSLHPDSGGCSPFLAFGLNPDPITVMSLEDLVKEHDKVQDQWNRANDRTLSLDGKLKDIQTRIKALQKEEKSKK